VNITSTNKDVKLYDNREIIVAGLLAGGLLWYGVDELETLWGEFTGWIDEKFDNFNNALSNVF